MKAGVTVLEYFLVFRHFFSGTGSLEYRIWPQFESGRLSMGRRDSLACFDTMLAHEGLGDLSFNLDAASPLPLIEVEWPVRHGRLVAPA